MPKDASFSMHSLLVVHYLYGAWYPKGGASEIAYHMIPIVEKSGGAVLVRAPVNRILFNDAKEACGESGDNFNNKHLYFLLKYTNVLVQDDFESGSSVNKCLYGSGFYYIFSMLYLWHP